jgi:hypothetical protein
MHDVARTKLYAQAQERYPLPPLRLRALQPADAGSTVIDR